MLSQSAIETAYTFLHQKRNVYIHSTMEWQRDDIEYAIASFVDQLSPEIIKAISDGRPDFLKDHLHFEDDITNAVNKLEMMLSPQAPEGELTIEN